MDWLKKKKRLVRGRERGAKLLEDLIECCDGKSNPIKFFSADQIIKATNNFSDSNRVPGLYYSYSGQIDNHPMIFLETYTGRDYCRNIAISSMVSGHKNFMKLLGCCLEFEDPVIVYNFMEISSLDLKMAVSWKMRIKIAGDIAMSLAYLHTAFPRPFVYRGMSLGNIILGEDGVARLSDFSECILIPQGETFVQVDRIAGTYGYMDDNYMLDGIVSEKTDIFGIGNLMQNLLIGTERLCELREEDGGTEIISGMNVSEKKVPRWLSKSVEELADPNMLETIDEVREVELCQMKAFLLLSVRCTGLKGEVPNMVEVTKELKKIQRSLKIVSAQDFSSSALLSDQTVNTKALLTCIAYQVFCDMFQWVISRWFRFIRKY